MNYKVFSRLGLALVAAVAASAAPHVQAEQLYYYVDVAGGQSKIQVACQGHPNCKKTAFGGKVVGGYEFTKLLALEGGIHYFGPVIHAVTLNASKVQAGAESYAYNFSLAGALNVKVLDRLILKGRLGAGWMRTSVSYTATTGENGSGSEASLQPLYGLGASFEFLPLMSVGLDYDATKVPHGAGGKTKLDAQLITASVRYYF